MSILGYEVIEEYRDENGKWCRHPISRPYASRDAADSFAAHANKQAAGKRVYSVHQIDGLDQLDYGYRPPPAPVDET